MSPTVFNLEFGQHLLVNYLAQASPQQVKDFRELEAGIIAHMIDLGIKSNTDDDKARETEMWASLASAQPWVLSWLASNDFRRSSESLRNTICIDVGRGCERLPEPNPCQRHVRAP